MSRVYFNDGQREAELWGSERAYAGMMVHNAALMVLNPCGFRSDERLRQFIDPKSYLVDSFQRSTRSFGEEFTRAWTGSLFMGKKGFAFEGKPLYPFTISLSTASLLGDQMSIFAWIHGQSEVHGYLEGEHRDWLAGIIDKGRKRGIFRKDQGWESVAAFLRESGERPVVLSYSVTDGFPGGDCIDPAKLEPFQQEGDEKWDSWERYYEQTSEEERWADGIEWLRSGGANVGALTPENIGSRAYGDVTAFDMMDTDRLREVME